MYVVNEMVPASPFPSKNTRGNSVLTFSVIGTHCRHLKSLNELLKPVIFGKTMREIRNQMVEHYGNKRIDCVKDIGDNLCIITEY